MAVELEAGSAVNGDLPGGCVQCRMGAKLVLLITGLCSGGCWYCPLSREKYGRDLVFANERPCATPDDVLEEARAMDALGTGVTGGDPLEVAERTARYIGGLKEALGKEHHVHLYTPTTDMERIRMVIDAGLDELRLHPPPRLWNGEGLEPYIRVIGKVKEDVSVGFEVPAVPGMERELSLLVNAARRAGARFVNLNELEISTANHERIRDLGYEPLDEFCTVVRGSGDLARRMVGKGRGITVHFCSSPYKDSVQLRNRLIRRGRISGRAHEVLTDDGTFILGIVEGGPDTVDAVKKTLKDIDEGSYVYDRRRKRLEIAPWILEEVHRDIPRPCYIVEEYASFDRLEVERRPLD